jgi:choline dehydrogenase-like flavoprotein
MIHPARFIRGVFEEELDGHVGPMGNPLYSQQFYETDASRGFVRGHMLVVERTFGPLSHALDVPWGSKHHGIVRRRFPHTAGVTVVAEDLPDDANRIELDPGLTDCANMAHLMGTARMGRDRRTSVVDAWHRAHDVPNLFIVDGSSFTTGAGVNPTSTIGALALRAADGIWERRREWI